MADFTPDPDDTATSYELPDDGDDKPVSSVNPTLEALANNVAHLMRPETDPTFRRAVASQTLQRIQTSPWVPFTTSGTSKWYANDTLAAGLSGVPSGAYQHSATTNALVSKTLQLPDGGLLAAIEVLVIGSAGHGALPANMPNISLWKKDLSDGSISAIGSVSHDLSAIVADYEDLHGIAIGPIGEVIDNEGFEYIVVVEGESSTNAQAGLIALSCTTQSTIIYQSPGEG